MQKKLSLAAKNVLHVLQQYAAQGVEKWCFAFITRVQACVATVRLLEIAWILSSDCIKLRGNHARSGSYVTRCKTSSPWVGKTRNTYRFYSKKNLLNTHQSLLSQYNSLSRRWTRFAAFNVEKQAARFIVPYLCRSNKDESPCKHPLNQTHLVNFQIFGWLANMSLITSIFMFNSVENKVEITFKSNVCKAWFTL